MDKQIIISVKTLVVALLTVLAGFVLYKLGPIIGIFLVSVFLVISIEPAVAFFRELTFYNKPLSRVLSVVLSYLCLAIVFILIFVFGLPPVLSQAQKLLMSLNQIPEKLTVFEGLDIDIVSVLPDASSISTNVLSATVSIFSNLASILSVFVISLYMSIDWENIKEGFIELFPARHQKEVWETINEVENKVGYWVKGQLTLMLAVGSISFLAFLIIGIDYPLALGLIACLLEIVPILGPWITAIFAAIVGFAESPVKGIVVFPVFFAIQELENNFLVPKVMEKASGFRPLVILFALLVGSTFFGVMGAILAVPSVMIGAIVVKKILKYK